VPRWVGLDEPQWQFPAHPLIDRLARTFRGMRGTDTRDPFDAVVLTVLMQLVTWEHGAMTWRRVCRTLGEPAPGPKDLRLPPTPQAIRAAGTWRLEAVGIGGRQARTLMEVARVPHVIGRVVDMPTPEALGLLVKIKGIGPWTAASVLGDRLGRPEPIPVGDFHIPNVVAWALAGEPRGTDARMLELLRPFDGVAYRVIRLLVAAGIEAPKFGPRRRYGRTA
jgi:3-methyladenine DNA glycosylase/8-oxoguanine DNA glycosylase